jgi:hypothetical protein
MSIENKTRDGFNAKRWKPGKYKWYDMAPVAGFITFMYRNQKREMEGHQMSPFEFLFYNYHGIAAFTGLVYLGSVVNS